MINFENGTINVYIKNNKAKIVFNIDKDKRSSLQIELELTESELSDLITKLVMEKNKL